MEVVSWNTRFYHLTIASEYLHLYWKNISINYMYDEDDVSVIFNPQIRWERIIILSVKDVKKHCGILVDLFTVILVKWKGNK